MISILLADDSKYVCEGLKKIIKRLIAEPIIFYDARSGKEALEIVSTSKIDIIITDICMPCMDGLEFIGKAKKVSPNSEFIILSGHENFSFAKTAIGLEVSGYLLKPVDEDELKGILEEVIGKFKTESMSLEELPECSENSQKRYIDEAVKYLYRHYSENVSLLMVAEHVGLNHSYFSTIFKKNMKMNYSDFLNKVRLEKAQQLLRETTRKIADIAKVTGFKNARYFSEIFREAYGMSPKDFRRK